MLFIIWKDNGEDYEDYYKFIDSIWKLKKKINIQLEYNRMIVKMFFELYGIVIYLNSSTGDKPYFNSKDWTVKNWKLYTKLCRDNSIEEFLIANGAKKIDKKNIQEIHI